MARVARVGGVSTSSSSLSSRRPRFLRAGGRFRGAGASSSDELSSRRPFVFRGAGLARGAVAEPSARRVFFAAAGSPSGGARFLGFSSPEPSSPA